MARRHSSGARGSSNQAERRGAAHRSARRRLLFLLAACSLAARLANGQVIQVKIGALLDQRNAEQQARLLERTIKMINEEASDAGRPPPPPPPQPQPPDTHEHQDAQWDHNYPVSRAGQRRRPQLKLEPMIKSLPEGPRSTFEADARACQLIEWGAGAIVGPASDGPGPQHVQSICDRAEVAHLELGPRPAGSGAQQRPHKPTPAHPAAASPSSSRLNLHPPAHLLTSAYMDLIYAWNWTSFALLYDDNQSVIRLQELFRESSGSWTSKWQIRLFQFTPTSGKGPLANHSQQHRSSSSYSSSSSLNNAHSTTTPAEVGRQQAASFRDLFWLIRQTGERNIVLDVSAEHLSSALKQAQQVGCMTEHYSFLLTSLDLHALDLEDFKYSRVKLSGFSLLHLEDVPSALESPFGPMNEVYLAQLGFPVRGVKTQQQQPDLKRQSSHHAEPNNQQLDVNRYRLSPPMELERSGDYLEPSRESLANDPSSARSVQQHLSGGQPGAGSELGGGGGWYRRGNAAADRLVEFLVEQQLRQVSRVRVPLASALLHDALLLYWLGLEEAAAAGPTPLPAATRQQQQQPSLAGQCLPGENAINASLLVEAMRRTRFRGLTGAVAFDATGQRAAFKLHLLGLAPDVGLIKVGEWDSSLYEPANRFPASPTWAQDELSNEERSAYYGNLLRDYQQAKLGDPTGHFRVNYTSRVGRSGALQVNQHIYERLYREQVNHVDTLIVTSKLSNPYFMLKETPNKLEGNDQYEGFAVDLIHELSRLINFKYRWREVPDKKYGVKEVLPNGSVSWNGIIGEIVRGHADLAVLDLTITAQREEAVDFTLPFMNTGISILFKKPTTKVTTLFSFLSPFSADVWAYVLAAYCSISTILYLVGHLSPYEWADPRPCRHSSLDTELLLRNQFSLLNSFWFTIGSLMQQGSDLTPRSMSTRTVAGIWYFFTLIMISSYTANLAAFLTVEKVVYPIESARDLSNQQEIKYGCVESGSTCTFFKDSQIDTYKRIHENMLRHRTYVKSNEHGQKRVEEGKFAFFMESTSIEYIVERNCNLTQIGGLLDSKGYGMATSKRSRFKRPYRTLLSEGILHLQETGVLHTLKNRWWKERRGGGTCTDDSKGGGVTELSLANVGGVFVVLLGGLAVSFLVAIIEFMWRSQREGSSRDRMCEQMMADLKFALSCKSSVKPVSRARRDRLRRERSQRHEQLSTNYRLVGRKQESSLAANHNHNHLAPNHSKSVSFEEPLLPQHYSSGAYYASAVAATAAAAEPNHNHGHHRKPAANELSASGAKMPSRSRKQHPPSGARQQQHQQQPAPLPRGELLVRAHRLESRRRLCLLSRQTIDASALDGEHLEERAAPLNDWHN